MSGLISNTAAALRGTAGTPGDKSISHRALLIGAAAVGETAISGLLEAEDVLRTATALRMLGVEIARDPADTLKMPGVWRVQGVGVGGLREPDEVLDLGNSGTGARLLMGLCATCPITATFTGDESLRGRPMSRVTTPLARFGARFSGRAEGRLPLTVTGAAHALAIDYALPVASAQVKSAILLAALNATGETRVVEPAASRDHTEIMLRHFGVPLRREAREDGGWEIALAGGTEIEGRDVAVPGDPSSAAFPLVAALIVPGSEVRLPGVGVNPLRAGLFKTLVEMGAEIAQTGTRQRSGEPIADLTVRAGPLRGIDVPAERAPAMIDEYPILAVAAAFATGRTRLAGIGELRVKESDRLEAITRGLTACGVTVEEGPDWLVIDGCGGPPPGGAAIATGLDHRIAMSFLVLGMAARAPTCIDNAAPIATSFPDFVALMNGLGATIAENEE
ncbi:MAG: 3-phosphoshikimate 1-carboxyvinyltransferase [Alphaproteobacteria bacterium]